MIIPANLKKCGKFDFDCAFSYLFQDIFRKASFGAQILIQRFSRLTHETNSFLCLQSA